jgi:hypothetical protein
MFIYHKQNAVQNYKIKIFNKYFENVKFHVFGSDTSKLKLCACRQQLQWHHGCDRRYWQSELNRIPGMHATIQSRIFCLSVFTQKM